MKRKIVNIINFIRGCEPRCEVDLYEPVREQIALLKTYGFRGSFLLQYDALIDPRFVAMMKSEDNRENEIGVWLEIVEPLCQKAGIPWRGRFPWDWHANVGFSVGYTPAERELLVDILFEDFKATFGTYPRVMGSWIIDTHTLAYAQDKYGLDASCNCKDQWGTDGYTLWGAYYNGAYYPSRNNVFSPAVKKENAIGVPVFRMLGSDPVYQYDCGLDPSSGAASWQGVITLEPVYSGKDGGGGEAAWVDWYLRENYNDSLMTYGYTQAGQENSFGWQAMEKGLKLQFERFAEMEKDGLVIETLGESGRWFKESFEETPPTATVCYDDWKKSGKQSVWYNCKNYRANLYLDQNGLRLRDLTLFSDGYRDRYLDGVCTSPVLQFDTLPVIDGNRFSGDGIMAGGYFTLEGRKLSARITEVGEDGDRLTVSLADGDRALTVIFDERGMTAFCEDGKVLSLVYRFDPKKPHPQMASEGNTLTLCHRGFTYSLSCSAPPRVGEGCVTLSADRITLTAVQ